MIFDYIKPGDDSLLTDYAHSIGAKRTVHWLPLLMLVWTFWIFATPIFQTGDSFPNWLWPTLASFAVFLWLFFRVYYRDRRQVIWCALGMVALGFAVTPVNPGAQGYIIYGCAYLVFSGSTRVAVRNMLCVLVLYSFEWIVLLHFYWVYLLSAVLVALAVAFMNINFLRKQEREAELRLSHDEVRRLATTAERERIGRDLHDLLGHTLSLIALKSELANKLFDRDAASAKREMADVERIARDALAQVRRAVTGIRAAGLAAELASAKLLLQSNGVHLECEIADVCLPVEVETALAMSLREAVTNIQRHARAAHVRIVLEAARQAVTLRVEDDGRGGAIVPGNGLAGMRERLAAIGAQLQVDSQRGRGTVLKVTAPLPLSAGAESEPAAALRRA
ncbi:sensor histidine kinase [Rudaea cellulosilytica]|uniref:sensor histidine kinase n=1 Tax=Rudaea cellulosilytica TaxID=540746 RepID=UPI0003798498|nr:sensor histidine kinase [Rudaea cellulosilytica]